MNKLANPIKTHSVSKILKGADPYFPKLWSEETLNKAADAARTARKDQTLRIDRPSSTSRSRAGRPSSSSSRRVEPRLPAGFSLNRPNMPPPAPRNYPPRSSHRSEDYPRLPSGYEFGGPFRRGGQSRPFQQRGAPRQSFRDSYAGGNSSQGFNNGSFRSQRGPSRGSNTQRRGQPHPSQRSRHYSASQAKSSEPRGGRRF